MECYLAAKRYGLLLHAAIWTTIKKHYMKKALYKGDMIVAIV